MNLVKLARAILVISPSREPLLIGVKIMKTVTQSKSNVKQTEALTRAVTGQSLSNYPQIFRGFMSMGIDESNIKPRENIFTYQAWKALGRQVRKGEHGVKVCTFVPMELKDGKADDGTDKTIVKSKPRTTTVFHISQTDDVKAGKAVSA